MLDLLHIVLMPWTKLIYGVNHKKKCNVLDPCHIEDTLIDVLYGIKFVLF